MRGALAALALLAPAVGAQFSGDIHPWQALAETTLVAAPVSASAVRDIALAVDGEGRPVIAWAQEDLTVYDPSSGMSGTIPVPTIHGARWDGVRWEALKEIEGMFDFDSRPRFGRPLTMAPQLATDGEGRVVMVWNQRREFDVDETRFRFNTGLAVTVQVQAAALSGEAWVELGEGAMGIDGISKTLTPSWHPALAIGWDGHPVVAWHERTEDGESGRLFVRRWDGDSWAEVDALDQMGSGLEVSAGVSALALGPDSDGDGLTLAVSETARGRIGRLRWTGDQWLEVAQHHQIPDPETGGLTLRTVHTDPSLNPAVSEPLPVSLEPWPGYQTSDMTAGQHFREMVIVSGELVTLTVIHRQDRSHDLVAAWGETHQTIQGGDVHTATRFALHGTQSYGVAAVWSDSWTDRPPDEPDHCLRFAHGEGGEWTILPDLRLSDDFTRLPNIDRRFALHLDPDGDLHAVWLSGAGPSQEVHHALLPAAAWRE